MKIPSWFDAWLAIPFYTDEVSCGKDCMQHGTHYCHQCMEPPVCERCWEKSTEHHGHQYIRVFTCSRRTAVNVKCMKKFWDVSGIQDYINNSHKVLYLRSNKEASKKNFKGERTICMTCSRILKDAEFKYCSIVCKKQMIESSHRKLLDGYSQKLVQCQPSSSAMGENMIEHSDSELLEHRSAPRLRSVSSAPEMVVSPGVFMRFRRKGHPVRAPFF